MSDQSMENLKINGLKLQIYRAQPLETLFEDSDPMKTPGKYWNLTTMSTGEHRGYQGTWEIKNNGLYFVDIYAYFRRPKGFWFWKKYVFHEAKVSDLFPEAVDNEVKAYWYTGRLNARYKYWPEPEDDELSAHIEKGDVVNLQWYHVERKNGKVIRVPFDGPA